MRRSRWLLAPLAAGVLAAGCAAPAKNERYARMVEDLGAEVRADRDSVPHAGRHWNDIEPSLREAVIAAPNDEALVHALARLMDALGDQHAAVHPRLPFMFTRALPLTVAPVGHVLWIGPFQPPLAPGEPWGRLETIDDAPIRTLSGAAVQLLGFGDGWATIGCRRGDGTTVHRTVPFGAWTVSPMLGIDPYQRQWLAASACRLAQIGPEHDRWIDVARLGERGEHGYLRPLGAVDPPSASMTPAHVCPQPPATCPSEQEIDRAIEQLRGCETITLDLQGCVGGTCRHAGRIAAYLFPPAITVAPFTHQRSAQSSGARAGVEFSWTMRPADERLHCRRLIVLVDGSTCSAAEHIPAALRACPEVTIIGSQTAGAEFSRTHLVVAGRIDVYFGGAPAVWAAGYGPVEGIGVTPDIAIPIDDRLVATEGPVAAIEAFRRASLVAALHALGLDPERWLDPR